MPDWKAVPRETWDKAKILRKHSTVAEKTLWHELRDRKLGEIFRRQHPVGPYIADFYCRAKLMVVEVDGNIHAFDDNPTYDKVREEYFESVGIRTLRVSNREVIGDLAGVLETIKKSLVVPLPAKSAPPPTPPVNGGGGESNAPDFLRISSDGVAVGQSPPPFTGGVGGGG